MPHPKKQFASFWFLIVNRTDSLFFILLFTLAFLIACGQLDNVSVGRTEWRGLLKDYWARFSKYCERASKVDGRQVLVGLFYDE